MDMQAAADRIEIAELLARYARGVDTKDWALWRTVFTDDAYIDYRSAGGIDGSREEVGEWLEKALAPVPMTQHFVGNIECDIDGDAARVRAMFYNPMQFPDYQDLSVCGGYYYHRLVRTDGGWRSRELIEENAYFVNPPPG
jgi:3-phenylpropionate/cinnamic acid dioxygenase small subunit